MSDIVIAGYLGFDNSGDEALLSVLLSETERVLPGKTVTVLSMRPRETSSLYGVRAVHRYDPFAVRREIASSRMFVFGGGSLLQDKTSRRSLRYYLSLLKTAEKYGKKTVLYSNGIGPLIRPSSRKMTADVLSRVDAITLRDADSATLLSRIGVPADRVTVTADAAFLLADRALPGGRDASFAGVPEGTPYAVISVREHGSATAAQLCRHLSETHSIAPLIVPMQYPRDLEESEKAARMSGCRSYVWRAPFGAADARRVFEGAVAAVGMRLHLLIFAAVAGVPFVGLSFDPKIDSLCHAVGMPSVTAGCGTAELLSAVDGVIAERDALAKKASASASEMARSASKSADILAEVFG